MAEARQAQAPVEGMRAALSCFETALGETTSAYDEMREQAAVLQDSWTGEAAGVFVPSLHRWLDGCNTVKRQLNLVYDSLRAAGGPQPPVPCAAGPADEDAAGQAASAQVSLEQMEFVRGEMEKITQQLQRTLSDLEDGVAQYVAHWPGDARETYAGARQKWKGASADMSSQLGAAGTSVGNFGAYYASGETCGLSIWNHTPC